MDTPINIFDKSYVPPVRTAAPPRRRRKLLLASVAVLVVAAAGGVFLLSPYNHVLPLDTARLGADIRHLAADVAAVRPAPEVMAPAARLATAPRPETKPATLGEVETADFDAQMRELLALRTGPDARPTGATAGQEAGQPEKAPGPLPSGPALPAAAPAVAEIGAAPAPLPSPAPAPVPAPTPAPVPAPSFGGPAGLEPGMATLAAPSAAPAAAVPVASLSSPASAEPASLAVSVDSRAQEQPASDAPLPAAAASPASPAPAAALASLLSGTATPAPSDPIAASIAMPPAASMTRGEQIDVLHLVTQLGVVMRDLRTENVALRAGAKASSDKVDNAVADFERRLALAESRGAVNAAMGVDAQGSNGGSRADGVAGEPETPTGPAARTLHQSGGPAPQPASLPGQAPASAAGGPRRYKVQAASPHLAMLSELDRSGGEGSQLQVGVGDQVPGYGRVVAIQQQGVAWIVKTDRGAIQ